MNSAHSHIKFTSTYDVQTKSIPFLDMWVTLKEGKFITDLYKKNLQQDANTYFQAVVTHYTKPLALFTV